MDGITQNGFDHPKFSANHKFGANAANLVLMPQIL
jgi:hypothetical protein